METKLYIGADGVQQLLREGGPLICPFGGRVVIPRPPKQNIALSGPPPPMELEILPMMCSSHCPHFQSENVKDEFLITLTCGGGPRHYPIRGNDIVNEEKKTNNLKTIK